MTGLTAQQTVAGVGHQLWLSRSMAALLKAWDEPMAQPGLRAWIAGARRRVDEHAEIWAVQLPESVLLHADDHIGPGPGDPALVDTAWSIDAAADRGPAIGALLEAASSALDRLLADAGPIGDGALLRSGAVVGGDLDRLRLALPGG